MTVGELRETIRQVVKRYFVGATVKWIDENNIKPTGPLVTLQLRNIQRELFSIDENRQGRAVKLWHTRAMLDVNLYTPGAVGNAQPGIRPKAENTALNDMQDFINYMDSDYVYGILGPLDVTILPEGIAQDVSELVDNSKYEYSAMQEFTVDFIQNAAGVSGLLIPIYLLIQITLPTRIIHQARMLQNLPFLTRQHGSLRPAAAVPKNW